MRAGNPTTDSIPVTLPRTLVVIPAFNEERTISAVVSSVQALGFPACVIDDGSVDATARLAREVGATVLSLPVNVGVGAALRCAFRYAIAAGYEAVVQVDGDGQHDPTAITHLLQAMVDAGADMVIGSRFIEPDPAYPISHGRKLAMGVLARVASRSIGTTITDATSGFRAIRAPLLQCFAVDYPAEYLGDTFEAIVLAGLRGARVIEHPVPALQRKHGLPSAGTIKSCWYVLRVLTAASLIHYRAAHDPLYESPVRAADPA